jgi:hypothetical protein
MSLFTADYLAHFSEPQLESMRLIRACFGDETASVMLRHANSFERQVAVLNSFSVFGVTNETAIREHAESETTSRLRKIESEASARISQIDEARIAAESHLREALSANQTLTATLKSTVSRERDVTSALRVKLPVPTFEGKSGDSLTRWLQKVVMSMESQGIAHSRMQINFAMSRLAGPAEAWAFALHEADPDCFESWEDFVDQLRSTFSPPDSEYKYHSQLLSCRQGSRTLTAYIQEVRTLNAHLTGPDVISEKTKVTIFMDGLSKGPVRNQVFRVYPQTLAEAFRVAERESHSVQSASGTRESDDMDISALTTEIAALRTQVQQYRKKQDLSKVVCFRCGKPGHMRETCRVAVHNLPASPAPNGGSGSPGNVSAQ